MNDHNGCKPPHPSRLAHTFSIVARDPQSGEMGVTVQSHWFSVGSLVTWAEAGVGAVATQALAEITYGPLGLALMRAGKTASEALASLLAADEERELRQVAMVNAEGRVATHTGTRCIADAGHETGEGFSAQANMMACPDVWPAMARAYREAEGDLAERMLAGLEAGQAAGGDIRGKQSASILIVKSVSTGRPWADKVMDLRVEDHPEPIRELHRLVGLHRAYQHMNRGDELLGAGEVEDALHEYHAAAEMAPEIEELPFWHAVTLADLGRVDEALPIFRDVFARNAGWATLLPRLPQAGLLRDDPEMMRRILAKPTRKPAADTKHELLGVPSMNRPESKIGIRPATPAQRIALWADELRDISAMGLAFCQNIHDRGNYRQLQNVAIEMLALATDEPLEQIEALRAPIFDRPAPIPVGDAAIIDDGGNILLVQRADNQKWAMPGGALAVGETPAEGVVREAFEETGVRCEPVALVGVFDSRLCGTVSRHHLYQFVFLCKPLNGGKPAGPPSHAVEVLGARWFAEYDLPDDLDPGHVLRIPEAFRVWHGNDRVHFDQ